MHLACIPRVLLELLLRIFRLARNIVGGDGSWFAPDFFPELSYQFIYPCSIFSKIGTCSRKGQWVEEHSDGPADAFSPAQPRPHAHCARKMFGSPSPCSGHTEGWERHLLLQPFWGPPSSGQRHWLGVGLTLCFWVVVGFFFGGNFFLPVHPCEKLVGAAGSLPPFRSTVASWCRGVSAPLTSGLCAGQGVGIFTSGQFYLPGVEVRTHLESLLTILRLVSEDKDAIFTPHNGHKTEVLNPESLGQFWVKTPFPKLGETALSHNTDTPRGSSQGLPLPVLEGLLRCRLRARCLLICALRHRLPGPSASCVGHFTENSIL